VEAPTRTEFLEFLTVFETLAVFEIQMARKYGVGAFPAEGRPNPAVVKTMAWLREQMK